MCRVTLIHLIVAPEVSKITVRGRQKGGVGGEDTPALTWHIMPLLLTVCGLELIPWSQLTAVVAEKCRRTNGYLLNNVSDIITMISYLPPFCHSLPPPPLFILLILFPGCWFPFIPCFHSFAHYLTNYLSIF